MTFAHPWLLLLSLPVAFAAWRLLRHGRRSGVRYPVVGRLPAKTAGWRAAVAAAAPFLLLAGLMLLVAAAARPRRATVRTEDVVREAGDSIAIVLAADTSGSMSEMDLAPPECRQDVRRLESIFRSGHRPPQSEIDRVLGKASRLAAVKERFAAFVARREGDQIALVTFGTFADARSPLTFDHRTLLGIMEGVSLPRRDDESSTAIGDGLAYSLKLLEDAKQKTKIVVLLSDGINNSGVVAPMEAAEIAKRRGIKVYTIGVGRDGEFDWRLLKSIASGTGGRYFSVSDAGAFDKAMEAIDRMEKSPAREVHTRVHTDWEELFAPWLYGGAALAAAAILLSLAASRRFA
ncbi:MAG: VWA domain-containing protein [Kiritimatiellae bacterium]|nr:VWA domain-containing protein [Kiritimatiellia bacterium]